MGVAVMRIGREGKPCRDILRVHHCEGESHVCAGHFLAEGKLHKITLTEAALRLWRLKTEETERC